MLFNSIDFAIFLPVVFSLYWFACNRGVLLQNLFTLAASYVFYGWWDWRFLILMTITIACSWASGLWMARIKRQGKGDERTIKRRAKTVMIANIVLNLLILGFFKYYNFFVQNFVEAFTLFGKELNVTTLKVILPVGISFYTFQALSYSIDVYRGKIEATRNAVAFFAFVSFFPQLVAGPIERATNLLPQFYTKRRFDYALAVNGARQILWGLFKKIVIADNCASAVNTIFESYTLQPASSLVLGAILFAFQIYGDFSGYSDIAIGTARLFGINLMKNFAFPYFSRDIAEFWRRWHISLTTWFRDYLYIPLGGSRGSSWQKTRNTFIIFLVSGFWHGANWTFIAWGAYHALLFVPLLLLGKNRRHTGIVAENRLLPTFKELSAMLTTFALVTIGWVIFRAEDMPQALDYLSRMCSSSLLSIPSVGKRAMLYATVYVILFMIVEWFGRKQAYAIEKIPVKSRAFRWAIYILIVLFITTAGGGSETFIYFQF
ncbi:MAG: MBOAT family protein [Odoribacteraceae bacterium]|jgi:D-alanyl-lipoteichoic acid acyltransferase DltB (MBOAT superfamily)|nr:MBOAT family protein [Odoribacteraceae bacterium]